ncbi:MAG: hypothetical protein ABSD49_09345 [Candidatus Bathyarchaeia archaeon]
MDEPRVLYAIAESCPFDSLLVMDMKKAVNALLQLNLKRFRLPQKTMTKYSALDIVKQALELLFEFAPSGKNYREAMRTIQVYSEGDDEMLQTLRSSFKFIANAVYNTYTGQRRAESLAPEILFLQGLPFDQTELQQAFRFVGVRPPDPSPVSVKKTYFLDEGFEPYRQFLEARTGEQHQKGREKHWAKIIESALSNQTGNALMRVGSEHVESHIIRFIPKDIGQLDSLLKKRDIEIKIVKKVADVNETFGKR